MDAPLFDADAIPEELKSLKQFCVRAEKQPYIRDVGRENSFTSSGWPEHRCNWLTFDEALDAMQKGVKVYHNNGFQAIEGIGFLVARDGQDGPQILGGDIDCCVDPETGLLSRWTTKFLKKVEPFYCEVSPSLCGLRFFVLGRLPGGRDKLFGNGPQDDLPEESRERILTAKPKAREKLAKGEPTFNGLEIYENGRHLTITSQKVEKFCFAYEDRSVAISEALEPFIVNEVMDQVSKEAKKPGPGGLPQLDICSVIDVSSFSESGGQLFGPHPTLGSTTGKNLVVNPQKGIWAWMHNGINSGGDAWLWLACMSGAVPWDRAGSGALKDSRAMRQTLEYAVQKGFVGAEVLEPKNEPAIRVGSTDDMTGTASEISEDDLLKIKIPENPRLKINLEPDNFVQEYTRYGETVTDSYPDYWIAGGLFCLSVAINRNAVIKLRQGPVYPNMWMNLLGLSSLARKSTAIDKTDLTIIAANIDPDCKMPDEFSPEAMIERLDQRPRAYMLKDESAGLLAVMKKDYMRGLKDALMQLYDGKDINRELRTSRRKSDKTSFQVKNPYLCLMLATTPGSFAANTELLDVTSGWLPRFLHFFPNHVKDRWLPLEEGVPENDLLSTVCQARLIKIRQAFYDRSAPLVMHLSKDADAYFKAWQKVREGDLVEAKDDRRAQFYSRLAVYVLKIGILFTIGRADFKDGLEISLAHIQEACRLVDEYFMPMAMTVTDLVGKAADKNLMDKIISVLTSRGGKITKRDLIRAVHSKKKDLDESLEALEESGEIRLVTISNLKGRPTIWLILSTDTGNNLYCHNVNKVYSSILSHQKEISEDVDEEASVRQYDNIDNMTICDKTPIDTDSENVTKSSIEMDLQRGDEQAKAKEAHDKELAAQYTKKAQPTDPIKVRFVKEYRTQIPRPGVPNAFDDKLYLVGEIAELQRWEAEKLLARGIVELVA